MRVAIGADHAGYELKEGLAARLRDAGYDVVDLGTDSLDSVDYPDFAAAVGRQVSEGKCDAGVVLDTMGIGSSMAANKVPGVRCALCHDVPTVLNSRRHNDANVLSLGSAVVPAHLARRLVTLWLSEQVEHERHLRRVGKIMDLEGPWNANG